MTWKMSQSSDIEPKGMRLQKFLARAGVASRRSAEGLISQGRVSVNGSVVEVLGTRVDPTVDQVIVDGVAVRLPDALTYIMLNKPSGFLTSASDPHGRPTVMDLVDSDAQGLFPVGRLDLDTTGLLIFTNDGEFGNLLTHPRHHVSKTYVAQVEGVLDDAVVHQLEQGVMLEDGPTLPAHVRLLGRVRGGSEVELMIREGRKRQVRRMMAVVGHPVVTLERVAVGSLTTKGLEQGEWRELTFEEIASLRCAAVG